MRLPISYSWRNLFARKVTTLLTAGGMAMVVFVFATMLMLREGLQQTMVQTGEPDNVITIRKGSETEIQSGIDRTQAALLESLPQVAVGGDGRKQIAKELVVLIALPKADTGIASNVIIRGTDHKGLALRPQIKLREGRINKPGSTEIIVGKSIAERFVGVGVGQSVRFGMQNWLVVGVFDAQGAGFDSEIWGDAEQMMQAFRRPAYSSTTFRLNRPDDFAAAKAAIDGNQRLTVEAKRENKYYADQSEMMANFIGYLGMFLSIVFSLGAIFGAMITMYASVANRVGEIGTLRALGFPRLTVMYLFLFEALGLGLVGGLLGIGVASTMQFFTISTMNFQSFSELAFGFHLTPTIVVQSLIFSLFMGLVGGFLPAARAARMNIVDALREA